MQRINISMTYLVRGTIICAIVFAFFVSPAYASHRRGCGHTAPGIDCGAETYCAAGCRTDGYMDAQATPSTNQSFSCASCTVACNSGFFDCTATAGCETADQRGGACTTGAGRPGTWSNACGTTCAETARPSVTLAPFAVQADDQANPAVWINKTGGGLMARFGGAGTDRVVVTNSGQLVLGLSSADWTTFTQTVGATENLIYAGITSTSTGNVLLLQRQGTPNLTLLQLDASGNLNVGAQVRAPEVCIAGVCRTTWPTGGLVTSGTATADTLPKFTGIPLTLTNSLVSEAGTTVAVSGILRVGGTAGTFPTLTGLSTGLSVGGNITGTGCFGPTFVGVTTATTQGSVSSGGLSGYRAANAMCAGEYSGSRVCSTDELFKTISCNVGALPASGLAWVNNGPPGFTATANDCQGWTTTSSAAFGAYWAFDGNGGVGWVQPCDGTARAFACCR